jgi:hypothetical protein
MSTLRYLGHALLEAAVLVGFVLAFCVLLWMLVPDPAAMPR